MNSSDQGALVFAIVAFCLYFLPTGVALMRGKVHYGGVIVVNLFLGWTGLGWIIALAMAASGPTNVKDALGRDFSTTRQCPRCAEQIQKAAVACRFCGYEFQAKPATP